MLTGHDAADLIAGAVAAASAAWASLRLFAPTPGDLRLSMLARLALRFPYHSLVAGMDVARRALDPRLPLRCGFILYPAALPPGPKRQAFTSVMSLLPGTVPAGANEEGELLIHCLDVGQPVAAQLAAEEALFARVFGGCIAMADFLLAAACFVLATVAIGLVRILTGPGDADRVMAAQLLGTGGIAVLLLLAKATEAPTLTDVALVLALLAAFVSVAFTRTAPGEDRE